VHASSSYLTLIVTFPYSVGLGFFVLMNWPVVFKVKPGASGVWTVARQIEVVLAHFLYACLIGFFSSLYVFLEVMGMIWWVSLMLILWSMKSKLALNESKRPSFAWAKPRGS
jgi:hypothetical protein